MRSSAARLALPVAVALVVLATIVAATAAPVASQGVDNGTTFAFDLRADGSAHVVVTTRYELANESDRTAFDQLAQQHRSGSDSPMSMAPFQRAASLSSEATGRSMAIQDVTRTADRSNGTGRLVLAFTWTNFANTSGSRMTVGDAFRTPTGTWLPGLSAGQELVISPPANYSPQSITVPETRYQLVNGSVHVQGPASFGSGTPSVVMQGPGAPDTPPPPTGGNRAVEIAAIVAALLLLALVAYLLRDRLPLGSGTDGDGSEARTTGAGDGGSESSDRAGDPDPIVDPLLSDEERVLRLLESEGGRMKQVAIVEATDWSNAKVSQLLSDMAEEDRIEKLRIGRENLISLPGRGPGSE